MLRLQLLTIFFTTRFNLYELWEVLTVQNNADTVCNTYNEMYTDECSRLTVRIENDVDCHMNPNNSF